MDLFPLAIFPQGSLSSSVIPVVWIGMIVVCFFNLRLGWVLSGLVIPGYLVPLMLIKPWAAGVVLFEGVLTYFLIWLVSEYLSRWAQWCNFFGRDRFFALVLCSIVVRLVFDTWLLPELGAWATAYWHIAFDYRNNLHSFGLIIVSLIANQFWKTGFFKGLIPLIVTLVLTLLIVRYGLMELTNFSLSNIGYIYVDMASSILATPKAYIILVSTAFLASRMNLHYGWDFNGILIPSLLALQWYQPVKILATIVESCIILWLAILLLKMPLLSKMTLEGARKLLLFFNISFAYKMLLGFAILNWFPDLKVTDYFGFGYLLSTLMAVKIHDKAIFARLTRATLQTSLMAVAAASAIGFSLTLLPLSKLFNAADAVAPNSPTITTITSNQQNLAALLQEQQIEQYQTKLGDKFILPLASEIDFFSNALSQIQAYLKHPDPLKLQQATAYLKNINYRLELVNNGRYLYLHEQAPIRGWGVYIFDTQAQSELALEIPAPLEEAGIFNAGVGLFHGFNARSLAISGSPQKSDAELSGNGLSFFQVFHRQINRHNSLQLRRYNAAMARQLAGVRRAGDNSSELVGLSSSLHVKERLPDGLNLAQLKQLLTHFNINWTEPPFNNQQRELSRYGFAELILTQQDLQQILLSSLLLSPKTNVQTLEQALPVDGYVQEWILNHKQFIAAQGSNLYRPPKQEELLFFDEQILTPLLKIIRQAALTQGNVSAYNDQLQTIAQAADIMGYQIIKYCDLLTRQNYFVLVEQSDRPQRYWGIYVFRLGAGNPYVLQIPRPLYEINSFEYGVALFKRLQAQTLMIATTHPDANFDGSADLINPANKFSVFNLVSQALLREAHDQELMLINARAFAYRPDRSFSDADVIFSLTDGVITREQLDRLPRDLLDKLEADGLKVQLLDGSEQTSGYDVGSNAQAQYLEATVNKNFAILWLSPNARASYRQQTENQLQAAQFNNFNIHSLEQELGSYLQQSFNSNVQLDGSFHALLNQYIGEQDVIRLQQVVSSAKDKGYLLTRVLDRNSRQAFLLILDATGIPFALANLTAGSPDTSYIDDTLPLSNQVVEFINQRKAWLIRRPN